MCWQLEPVPGLEPRTPDYKSGALPITLMPASVGNEALRRDRRDNDGVGIVLIVDNLNVAHSVAVPIANDRGGISVGFYLDIRLLHDYVTAIPAGGQRCGQKSCGHEHCDFLFQLVPSLSIKIIPQKFFRVK